MAPVDPAATAELATVTPAAWASNPKPKNSAGLYSSAKLTLQPAVCFYILAIPASLIAWGHNIATAIFVRNMMREFTGGAYVGTYGNAVWLTLAGTVSTSHIVILDGWQPQGLEPRASGRRRSQDQPDI